MTSDTYAHLLCNVREALPEFQIVLRRLPMSLPINGHSSKSKASVMITATSVEFVQKIVSDPLEKIIDWRKASSVLSPSTIARTMGAMG